MTRLLASRWTWAAGAALLALAAGIAAWIWFGTPLPPKLDPYSRASFDTWLAQDAKRAGEFYKFRRFLTDHGVGKVVPAWQLTRTDRTPLIGCRRPAFLVPPPERWRNIVPVLRLLDKEVVPLLGPVEVVSAYRTSSFNGCVGGASQSRHLSFSAVDLIALRQQDKGKMFRQLCALQRRLGPKSKFGLGAYFNPNSPSPTGTGRFHVDTSGYRSWGYTKHAGSSACRLFTD